MTTPLLEVDHLAVRYGGVTALVDVSLTVQPGHTVAVLGANGAGKTTLLRAITGLVPTAGGAVRFDGEDVTSRAPHDIAARGLAHVPDHRGLFPTMTVEENLKLALLALDRPVRGDSFDEVMELFPILRERRAQVAGTMSGGQQQMLTIARSLLQEPRLLLLDEMSMGLAPAIVEDLFDVLRRLQERGIAVLLVEQFVGQALGVADELVVLEQGRVVSAGTPETIAGDELAAAYLGGDESSEIPPPPPPPAHVREQVPLGLGPRRLRQLERLAERRDVAVEDLLADQVDQLLAAEHEEVAR